MLFFVLFEDPELAADFKSTSGNMNCHQQKLSKAEKQQQHCCLKNVFPHNLFNSIQLLASKFLKVIGSFSLSIVLLHRKNTLSYLSKLLITIFTTKYYFSVIKQIRITVML